MSPTKRARTLSDMRTTRRSFKRAPSLYAGISVLPGINTTTCYLYNRMNVQQYPALYFVWLFTPFAIVSLHFVAQERAKSTCFSSSEKEPEKLSFFVPFSLRRAVKFDRLTQPLGSCVLFSVRKQRRSITCRQRQQLQQLLLPLRLHQLYTYRSRA